MIAGVSRTFGVWDNQSREFIDPIIPGLKPALPFIMISEEESPMGADSGGPGEAFLYDAGRIWRVDS